MYICFVGYIIESKVNLINKSMKCTEAGIFLQKNILSRTDSTCNLFIKMHISARYISYKAARNWYANLKLVKPTPQDPPFKHVVQIGDPTLRQVAVKLYEDEIGTPEIQFLVKRLKYVFKKYNCVGLSAPQIGASFQILLAEFNHDHLKIYSKKEIESKEITLQPETVRLSICRMNC